jgi:hypothetical protein
MAEKVAKMPALLFRVGASHPLAPELGLVFRT